ncbi:hypothetical protein JD969_07420 [Planctomycetota bacterium]|nr:hypothetical protein JD969_07420 [Planctomycetota bacterium]
MKKIWLHFQQHMLADKKKTISMCGLSVLGLLLWGRLLLKEVPHTATAKPSEALQVDASHEDAKMDKHEVIKTVEVDLPNRINRNLFHFDNSRYRRTVSSDNIGEKGKLGKDEDDVVIRIAEVRIAASRLELSSVVTGDQSRAVINGIVVVPGEKIAGFELRKVYERTVVLARDGVLVRLGM